MADDENYDNQDENDKEYAVIPGIPPTENPREKKVGCKRPWNLNNGMGYCLAIQVKTYN